ncbi:hypothetical protein BJ508DRAFT_315561 [Ascobolus immersus RN42]|uniref:Uncharacterized protein n=1 Tax=Ascobolus immersus RN42 TaxID=1160509 RepID=A0A3N4HE62_ASCIM|nr:hypothetical protein BJ508DRAFT_315561 [Ascobolus immersus RN42]
MSDPTYKHRSLRSGKVRTYTTLSPPKQRNTASSSSDCEEVSFQPDDMFEGQIDQESCTQQLAAEASTESTKNLSDDQHKATRKSIEGDRVDSPLPSSVTETHKADATPNSPSYPTFSIQPTPGLHGRLKKLDIRGRERFRRLGLDPANLLPPVSGPYEQKFKPRSRKNHARRCHHQDQQSSKQRARAKANRTQRRNRIMREEFRRKKTREDLAKFEFNSRDSIELRGVVLQREACKYSPARPSSLSTEVFPQNLDIKHATKPTESSKSSRARRPAHHCKCGKSSSVGKRSSNKERTGTVLLPKSGNSLLSVKRKRDGNSSERPKKTRRV